MYVLILEFTLKEWEYQIFVLQGPKSTGRLTKDKAIKCNIIYLCILLIFIITEWLFKPSLIPLDLVLLVATKVSTFLSKKVLIPLLSWSTR